VADDVDETSGRSRKRKVNICFVCGMETCTELRSRKYN